MATENRKARKFIDFDLNFRADDQTKDITESVNENAVRQALKSLLLTRKGERFGWIFQSQIGRLPNSRPGAGRLYRKFVGDKAFQTGFGGYVVGKSIKTALPQIQEEYLERVFRAIKLTTQMAKVVDIPIRISTSGKTGLVKKVA